MPVICETCRMPMGYGRCPECDRVHNERVALVEKLDRESGAAAERARIIREDLDRANEDIDNRVDRWHAGEGKPGESLASFLGFTDEEYRLWAEDPDRIPNFIRPALAPPED